MNIVLIGMRGSGKSTIGSRLSTDLLLPLVETDTLIEEKAQQSITEIVKEHGWDYFRILEREAVADCTQMDNILISSGGGAILSKYNSGLLKKNGILIYLKVSPKILTRRIENESNRPFLTDAKSRIDDVIQTLQARKKLYEENADFVIENEDKAIDTVCADIMAFLSDKGVL